MKRHSNAVRGTEMPIRRRNCNTQIRVSSLLLVFGYTHIVKSHRYLCVHSIIANVFSRPRPRRGPSGKASENLFVLSVVIRRDSLWGPQVARNTEEDSTFCFFLNSGVFLYYVWEVGAMGGCCSFCRSSWVIMFPLLFVLGEVNIMFQYARR